ncbi:AAA family ATPase [Microbulbifer sp. TRSA002]|uniref:AAA family ATPase n=1 Tax=Microbulbifer sp. TRSA002 TaxID=3243382 RepID=UPI00403965D2
MDKNHFRVVSLTLAGHRKDYRVNFNPGVNIIYGDSATGKSSILQLISYCLCASDLDLYDELEESVSHAILEIYLGGEVYCIKRDIFDSRRKVEIYLSDYKNINEVFPRKLFPNVSGGIDNEDNFSNFIYECLGYPSIKIKQSPTKDQSKMSSLSFRHLFKYCYVNQDDLGSKNILSLQNRPKYSLTKEVFKYIFNALDDEASAIHREISEKTSEKNKAQEKYKTISEFLREIDFESSESSDNKMTSIEEEISNLEELLSSINSRITEDSDIYSEYQNALTEVLSEISYFESQKDGAVESLDKFSRLKNDYSLDLEKLEALREAGDLIGRENPTPSNCPICDTKIEMEKINLKLEVSESISIDKEIKSIKSKLKNTITLEDNLHDEIVRLEKLISARNKDKNLLKGMIDEEASKYVSPYLKERDSIVSTISSLKEKKNKYAHFLKIRNQQNLLVKDEERLETAIRLLKEKLENIRKEFPDFNAVLSRIGDSLNIYLKNIKIKNREGVSIGETSLLPKVRNRDYEKITSGGLRTIVSIGYFSSILEESLNNNIRLPSFLMIDTVGKYLGKTKEKYLLQTDKEADAAEGTSDPDKYNNIYRHLIDLSIKFEGKGKGCQIILVDNDVPLTIAEEHLGFVVAQFDDTGIEHPIGLIDDVSLAVR